MRHKRASRSRRLQRPCHLGRQQQSSRYNALLQEARRGAFEVVIVEAIDRLARKDSPRAIARRPNQEHVPGPYGRVWQDTTIRGQKERGTGILNNELYIGKLVWNRCS
jgi:hypothetical protein